MEFDPLAVPIAADQAEHATCTIVKIAHSFDVELPEQITKEVANLLHLAGHVYQDGEMELPMLFVGLDKDGHGHLIDPTGIPVKPMVTMMVKRVLDKMDAVAVIAISEGHQLPPHIAKQWAENGRPEGGAVSEHPEAFEVLFMQIETLNGTWHASAKLSKFVAGVSRIVEEELKFEKVKEATGRMSNLLLQNRPEGERESPLMALLATMMGGRFEIEKNDDVESSFDPLAVPPEAPSGETAKH